MLLPSLDYPSGSLHTYYVVFCATRTAISVLPLLFTPWYTQFINLLKAAWCFKDSWSFVVTMHQWCVGELPSYSPVLRRAGLSGVYQYRRGGMMLEYIYSTAFMYHDNQKAWCIKALCVPHHPYPPGGRHHSHPSRGTMLTPAPARGRHRFY